MSTLTIAIVIVFCIGYFCIAIESVTKINKAAIALLMFVATWTLFMIDPASYIATAIGEMKAAAVSEVIEHHLGSTATTLFFLMGAMTIVELVDQNGGFNFVRDTLQTKSKRALLLHPVGHPGQPDDIHRDDHDSAQAGERQDRPHHLRCAGRHLRQFGRRVLAHRRRDYHHAVEQGCHHCSRCHHGDFHSLAGVDGHPGLHPVAVAEGQSGRPAGDGNPGRV